MACKKNKAATSNRSTAPKDNQSVKAFAASVENYSIDSLIVNPRNSRTHSRKQTLQIANSIKSFGFVNPILIDCDAMIIAGHGRWMAAKELGLSSVPVIIVDHLTESERRALVIADNKIAQNSGWDSELLALELGELTELLPEIDVDLDISITGFETAEIDLLLDDHEGVSPDPADQVNLEPDSTVVSRKGDIWSLGKHRIMSGDARSSQSMALLIGDKKAGLVSSDAPYNVPVQGHVGGRGKIQHEEFAFASGEMSRKQYRKFLKNSIKVMADAAMDGALIYLFIDWRHVEDMIAVGGKLGLELKNVCVWAKTTPGQGSFYRSSHELVTVFQKPGAKATNNIQQGKFGRNRSNVWTYAGVNTFATGKDDDLSVHPTVKPTNMIVDLIKDASHRGQIVLDSFLGSGTTLLACERTGRVCRGMEYEAKYIDVAIRRWQAVTGKDAVLVHSAEAEEEGIPKSADAESRLEFHRMPPGPSDQLCGLIFDEVAELRAEAKTGLTAETVPLINPSSLPIDASSKAPVEPSNSVDSGEEAGQ